MRFIRERLHVLILVKFGWDIETAIPRARNECDGIALSLQSLSDMSFLETDWLGSS